MVTLCESLAPPGALEVLCVPSVLCLETQVLGSGLGGPAAPVKTRVGSTPNPCVSPPVQPPVTPAHWANRTGARGQERVRAFPQTPGRCRLQMLASLRWLNDPSSGLLRRS